MKNRKEVSRKGEAEDVGPIERGVSTPVLQRYRKEREELPQICIRTLYGALDWR